MPKAKTKKAVLARFKKTAGGKLLRRQQGRKHILSKKTSKRKRALSGPQVVAPGRARLYKRLMKGV